MWIAILVACVVIVIAAVILVLGIKFSVIMGGLCILLAFGAVIGFLIWVVCGLIQWFDEV